jgi:hypothetical protein
MAFLEQEIQNRVEGTGWKAASLLRIIRCSRTWSMSSLKCNKFTFKIKRTYKCLYICAKGVAKWPCGIYIYMWKRSQVWRLRTAQCEISRYTKVRLVPSFPPVKIFRTSEFWSSAWICEIDNFYLPSRVGSRFMPRPVLALCVSFWRWIGWWIGAKYVAEYSNR